MIAYDGRQALFLAHACAPALAITGLEMPRMGGASLIAALRKVWDTDLSVVLVSASPISTLPQVERSDGATDQPRHFAAMLFQYPTTGRTV